MTPPIPRLARRTLAAALLGLLAGAPGLAQEPRPIEVSLAAPWEGARILEDPAWRKRFLGSYGVLSGREPSIHEGEREILREVLELMGESPESAAQRLGQEIDAQSSAALHFVLANLQFQTGQDEAAERSYQKALDAFPDFRRAHKNLALLHVQQGSCEAALEHLTRALELGDREGRTYGLLGYCYLGGEEYLAAEHAYRSAILQQPKVQDWKLGLARALMAMHKHADASALLESLIGQDPEDTRLWLLQANAFLGLERTRAAAANLEAVRMLGQAERSTLVLLGDIYMNEGIPELAEQAYLEVIRDEATPETFPTALRAARLMVRTRAWKEAGEILDSIAERYEGVASPDQELELLGLEARVATAQGHQERAAELLETIVRRDGTRGDALLDLAAHHRQQGDAERAIFLLERAQKLEGSEYQALLEHAQILVGRRDYRKAAELLRSALQVKSEPRVERYLARVEQAIQPR